MLRYLNMVHVSYGLHLCYYFVLRWVIQPTRTFPVIKGKREKWYFTTALDSAQCSKIFSEFFFYLFALLFASLFSETIFPWLVDDCSSAGERQNTRRTRTSVVPQSVALPKPAFVIRARIIFVFAFEPVDRLCVFFASALFFWSICGVLRSENSCVRDLKKCDTFVKCSFIDAIL